MTNFTDVFLDLIKKCRIRLSGDLLLVLSFCIIASCSITYTYSGKRPKLEGLSVTAEPVYLSQGASLDITNIIQTEVTMNDTDDIQYIVRNEDGSPSTTMRVVKGELQADEPGTGYLYIYINGEASQTGIPVHVYETEAEKEEAVLVHEQLKQNEVLETDPVPAAVSPAAEVSADTPVTVSSGMDAEIPAAMISDDGRSVVFGPRPAVTGLTQVFKPDYYSGASSGEGREYIALVIDGVRTDKPVVMLFGEKVNITAWTSQKSDLLPWIWKITPEGERILLSAAEFTWETSDAGVIAVEDGVPGIAGEGEADLTGTLEGSVIHLHVTVTDPGEITDFNTESDDPYTLDFTEDSVSYRSEKTFYWPTELPEKTDKKVKIKGGRIYQCGSQYYYLEDDIETEWEEDFLNDAEAADGMIRLSQGLTLMEGDNLSGIVPGVVFRHHDQFWVYTGSDEPGEPYEDDDGWIDISELFDGQDDYDPGADTGPESDALSYPDAQFNPYPGTISSNCTYAVWALANQALGVRLPNWGDAGNWYRRAGISGYPTGQNPAPYSIVVWDHHVGFVTEVSEDGTMMYVKEGNVGGRYREAWWPVSESRHGQKLYGFIYLTNDHGDAIQAKSVEITAGFEGTEDDFLKTLEELGLEPGERSEEYSEDIEEGYIISYTTGELAVGSVVNYTVSLGEEPKIVIDDTVLDELIGMTKEDLLIWFDKHGLIAGAETVEESDQETGIVLQVVKGSYKEGEEVDFTTSEKKPEPTNTPTTEPEPTTIPTAEPMAEPTSEPTSTPNVEPTDDPETEQVNDSTSEETEEPAAAPEEAPAADPFEDFSPTTEPVTEPASEPESAEEPTVVPEGITLPAEESSEPKIPVESEVVPSETPC